MCLKGYNSLLAFLGAMGHSLGHKAVLIHSLGHRADTSGAERHSYGGGFASFRIQLLFPILATQQSMRVSQQSHQHYCLAAGQDLPLSVPFYQCAAFDPAQARALPSEGGEVMVRRIWSFFRSCAQLWVSRSLPACLQTCLVTDSSIKGDTAQLQLCFHLEGS